MPDTIIFLGPTMPRQEAAKHLDAIFLPPAAQRDIYAAFCHYRPSVIGLIDGVFQNVPSVWHKEILFCMSEGCHVMGASSMGALRAAELSQFGMVGIGEIYQAFKSGRLEDDDEVAIVHGPEGVGYPQLTEAMVNIRATLEFARSDNIITPSDHDELLATAKKLHYKDRSYAKIFEIAKGVLGGSKTRRISRWLPVGRVDQKKRDAESLLKYIAAMKQKNIEKKQVIYKFENTYTWEAVTNL